VGAVVLQLHTKLSYISDLPLSYVYGALVIDQRAFSRLSGADQAVVREVMESIYDKIDAESVRTNDEALKALVDKGLKLVKPDENQVPLWRERVARSNRELAQKGVVSEALLDEMLGLLENFRAGHAP